MHRIFTRLALLFLLSAPLFAANCAPMMGLGSIQVFDNNGKPLTAGVLYSFQAGTSSQQATYTDSTCATLNSNPIPFNTGARATIWLNTGAYYKFVLCVQNDGPACAPADTLFSVDQVPGNLNGSSSSSGGSTFTGTFITGSSNPASSGVLRLASGDSICFRNAANSANLCLSKDSSDVVSWASGAFKLPEIACSASGTGFDYLCADSTAHRWKFSGNGGSQIQVVGAGVDINTSDQVIQLHFGSSGLPLNSSSPATNQCLIWNGTNIIGGCDFVVSNSANGGTATCSASNSSCATFILSNAHTLTRLVTATSAAQSGCSTNGVWGIIDLTSSSVLASLTPTSLGILDSGALSVAMTAGHTFGIGITTQAVGCGSAGTAVVSATYY